ncbi:MAG: adenylyltransferase/cytidyltransferase family protein [Parcubacteria group bacterium]|nr:adenylyltransferase/cytidyltransferase family protein [Parcubacteria group bacterium]
MSKRVLVFGTFDGLHPGHVFFLRKAKTKGDELVVAVARDKHVQILKDKRPNNIEEKRRLAVEGQACVSQALLSDLELGEFEILKKVAPDLIVLGYDQVELEEALLSWMTEEDRYIPMQRIKKL